MKYNLFFPVVSKSRLPANPKHGLAWNKTGRNDVTPFDFSAYHNWEVQDTSHNVQGLERVQNFSSDYRPYGSDMNTCTVNMYERLRDLGMMYRDTILFLNEPELLTQANKTPKEAIKIFLHAARLCPYADWTLPQVSHQDYYNGWQWARAYLREWKPYQYTANVVYGSFHSYIDEIDQMVDSYREMLAEFGLDLPILLTEYGHPDPDTAVNMYRRAMSNPHIKQAFWYTSWVEDGVTSLFDGVGDGAQLTAVGKRLLQEIER